MRGNVEFSAALRALFLVLLDFPLAALSTAPCGTSDGAVVPRSNGFFLGDTFRWLFFFL